MHVTAPLASLEGRLDEYLSLSDEGLTALQLDVKDENGEVGFARQAPALARAIGAAQGFYNPSKAAQAADAAGVYLIGRVVVFQDPVLATERPRHAIQGAEAASGRPAPASPGRTRTTSGLEVQRRHRCRGGRGRLRRDHVRRRALPHRRRSLVGVFRASGRSTRLSRSASSSSTRAHGSSRWAPVLGGGLRADGYARDGNRPAPAAARTPPRRHVSDGLPLPLRGGRVSLDDPNAVPGVTVARALRDFRRELRGYDTLIVPWLQDFSWDATTPRGRAGTGPRGPRRQHRRLLLGTRPVSTRRPPSRDPSRRAEFHSDAHRPGSGVWKVWKNELSANCGEESGTGLHCPPGPSRLPLAPSTERD